MSDISLSSFFGGSLSAFNCPLYKESDIVTYYFLFTACSHQFVFTFPYDQFLGYGILACNKG
ncbi:hypothetical protein JEP40_01610 [Proteus vulgaris]|uniref:hypothetical protein n=1 Tax=Proteus vulgaris TaxID=585 RepID=UPI0018E47274|nr:hypothetical protein [Proteus vulgaris]MBI6527824.1 hypothetical protein [Proteus vulgaris]